MQPLLVTAHSGCLDTPANSLAFLDAALDAGADFLEFDLRLSAERTLVLSHDPLTQGPSNFLSLDDVWTLVVEGGAGLNLDVKEYGVLEALGAFLQRRWTPQAPVVVTGCSNSWVTEARAVLPPVPVLLNVESGPEGQNDTSWEQRVVAQALACGAAGLNADHRLVTPGLADRARRALLPLLVWTVNRPEDLRRLVALGVSGVTTDFPSRAHRILTGF